MPGHALGKTALITGASNGIGYELAKVFAKNGWDLILTARGADKLREFVKDLSGRYMINAHAVMKDLADPRGAEELFKECRAKSWSVDALVNNAGVGSFGFFSETDLLLESKLLELNIASLTKLTKLFLKPMIARGGGYILNVASTAAFQPGPLMAVYYASKAYVLSFSEALADELTRSHVFVTALCPGATKTGFQDAANMQGSKLFKDHAMNAADVAAAGYDGMMRGKRIVIPGIKNRVMAASVRFAPRRLVTKIVRKIQEVDKVSR